MKRLLVTFLFIFPLLYLSCKGREFDGFGNVDQPAIALHIMIEVPSIGTAFTRAVEKTSITDMNVMVFEDEGEGYRLTAAFSGSSLTNTAPLRYEFYALLPPSINPLKLYLIANVPELTGMETNGETEEEVRLSLTRVFTSAGFEGTLPMFGELEFEVGVTEDQRVPGVVVRSVARVDVINETENFTLTSVQVYRASNTYQIIPNELINYDAFTASIPEGTTQTIQTNVLEVEGNSSVMELYIPESPVPDNMENATVVVVGGRYGDDTMPTYYRLDFVMEGNTALTGQVLRNHRYGFYIEEVRAPGWRTPDEAAQYASSFIQAEVKVWNEETVYLSPDENNYFYVSSRTINIPAPAGSLQSIQIDTSLESYQVYWADAEGNINVNRQPITWGESFTNAGIYTVTISDDGTQITASSSITSAGDAYLLIAAERIQVLITITQGTLTLNPRLLKVYGRADEIGSLGNYLLGTNREPGARAGGMSLIMRNKTNFGPEGVVSFEGIAIGGYISATVTASLLSMFDVVYLPYPYNPNATDGLGDIYLNWREASNKRVMIVQYDNTGTNPYILSQLGVSIVYNSGTYPPYTVSPDAPTVIMEGPFGAVDHGMLYRCSDDAFSEIPMSVAEQNNITPVLLGKNGGVVLGIDFDRRIVFSGDIDLYSNEVRSGLQGQYISTGNGVVENDAEKIIANLWAWIASVVLSEEQ